MDQKNGIEILKVISRKRESNSHRMELENKNGIPEEEDDIQNISDLDIVQYD